MRRVPQQARSHRRIEAILDAASTVIGEIGFEAATTNMFAERADTSIGSVYQFFENKDAIIAALCDRHVSELDPLLQEAQTQEPVCEQQLQSMLNILSDHYFIHAGFRALMYGTYAPTGMSIIQKHLFRPIVGRLSKTIQQMAPDVPEMERNLHAEVMLYAFSRVLYLVAQLKNVQEQSKLLEGQKALLMAVCRAMLTREQSS
jgi:AcrR family transcriptional regulator